MLGYKKSRTGDVSLHCHLVCGAKLRRFFHDVQKVMLKRVKCRFKLSVGHK